MLDYLSEVFMNLFVSVLMFFVMIYLLVLFDQSGIIHFILATGLHMIIRKRKFLFFYLLLSHFANNTLRP